ncbi:uncharacterized protein A4U43_C05F19410 [Asparagus officinalis]|uniref:Uncharacterized protein n=1 Tax=Asparagus officinalis TaxID=4686 RepID=A0A5P1EST4_ASPOF|nr:protein SPEAR1 [Asparagus officinalis]ONK69105.1 uncharacterized protein A4U43_C05F19410 [Asparagus officinalis]
MGSSHFGELALGNNGRSGSSRKGKKNTSEKPKQPQRGLGVAQLEKIRLHNQMASYLPSLNHPPFHNKMGFGDVDQRRDIGNSGFQSGSTARQFSSHMAHHWGQQTMTLPLLEQNNEDVVQKKRRHDRCHSMSSMSQNSDTSDTQELDLELKLSL